MRKVLLNILIMLVFALLFFNKEVLGEGFAYSGGDNKKANAQTSIYPPMPRPIFPLHPIEMSVTTDKKTYNGGEVINFVVSVKNLRAKPFILIQNPDPITPVEPYPVVELHYELFVIGEYLPPFKGVITNGVVHLWETSVRGYSNVVIGGGSIIQPIIMCVPPDSRFNPRLSAGEYILKVKLIRENRKNESYEASTYFVIHSEKIPFPESPPELPVR